MTKVFWLFGRSGAGKTTLALKLRDRLVDRQISVVYLDGDEMRATLCSDLGFSSAARLENHRRIAIIASLLAGQGLNVVVSTMAPEHQQRDLVSQILQERLVWFYIHAPLEVCIQRDPKGIYKRAQEGKLQQLINYPFELPRPQEQENYINTVTQNIETSFQAVFNAAKVHLSDSAL